MNDVGTAAGAADMVQLLAPDGTLVEHPDFTVLADDDLQRQMLRDMVLGRRYDLEATALQRHGELGLFPPGLGQEATQIGTARALTDADHVFPTYREHALALVRGITPSDMLGLWRGTSTGDWDTEGTRTHLFQLVIGSQTLHAVGYAMGLTLDARRAQQDTPEAAVLVFHGDGASSQGDVNEAYVFAASQQAPVVFVCQNNQWAISEPTRLQSRVPLAQRASGFGFPGVRVDGNDVLAMHAVTTWALDRARRGHGPTLIEAFTYRMGAHTTSDDPSKYRSRDETEAWRARDPIDRLRTHLLASDAIDQTWWDALDSEAEAFGAQVRAACHALTAPALTEVFDRVFADTPEQLADQQAEAAAWLDGFEDAS